MRFYFGGFDLLFPHVASVSISLWVHHRLPIGDRTIPRISEKPRTCHRPFWLAPVLWSRRSESRINRYGWLLGPAERSGVGPRSHRPVLRWCPIPQRTSSRARSPTAVLALGCLRPEVEDGRPVHFLLRLVARTE